MLLLIIILDLFIQFLLAVQANSKYQAIRIFINLLHTDADADEDRNLGGALSEAGNETKN